VGVLYNFVQDGKVYFFQGGFNYQEDKHLKPGLATHACAIQHYLDLGFRDYDFMVGDARYKSSLAPSSRALAWVVFRRSSIKLATIDLLRAVKRTFKGDQGLRR
jgi:CelD/BcsL family acetyltransferase involved in cellulose biosynthesis